MPTKNDITGDLIKDKQGNRKAYEDNFEKIFGKREKTNKPKSRIDVIGQNGNNGEHYFEDTST